MQPAVVVPQAECYLWSLPPLDHLCNDTHWITQLGNRDMTDLPIAPPRIIVEMTSADDWTVEFYLNGSRCRESAPPYMISELVKDCMARVEADRKAAALRAHNEKLRRANERHRRVWKAVAYGAHGGYARGFGTAFANKTVGKIGPERKEPKAPKYDGATVDLL